MICVVVTRNGDGEAWRFESQLAVRLHPLVQLDDVCACSAAELLGQYGRRLAPDLARHVLGTSRHQEVLSALEAWRARDGVREAREAQSAADVVWRHLLKVAPAPPTEAAELITLITNDRRAREGRVIRSLPTTGSKEANMTETAAAETKTRAARLSDDATIKVLAESNPKRAGSKSFDVFAKYKDGMTVKQAKEAGISTADLRYDSEHSFISITDA